MQGPGIGEGPPAVPEPTLYKDLAVVKEFDNTVSVLLGRRTGARFPGSDGHPIDIFKGRPNIFKKIAARVSDRFSLSTFTLTTVTMGNEEIKDGESNVIGLIRDSFVRPSTSPMIQHFQEVYHWDPESGIFIPEIRMPLQFTLPSAEYDQVREAYKESIRPSDEKIGEAMKVLLELREAKETAKK